LINNINKHTPKNKLMAKKKAKKKKLSKSKGKKLSKKDLKKKDKKDKKDKKGKKKQEQAKKKKQDKALKKLRKSGAKTPEVKSGPDTAKTVFSERSANYNVRDAIGKLRSLKNTEDVNIFIKGEKRVTITKAVPAVLRKLES